MNTPDDLTFRGLEAKRKGLVDDGEFGTFSSALGLRPRRCTSWLERAEREMEKDRPDHDAAFIFYWIAFNAAYEESRTGACLGEEDKKRRDVLFDEIIALDRYDKVSNAIPMKCKDPIMEFLDNKYVFQLFWARYKNWEETLERERDEVDRAPLLWRAEEHTKKTLSILFDRLYVLRNQLIHGGATWKGSMNREQVISGARTTASLVTLFTELMMDNPDTERALRCLSWRERADQEMARQEPDYDAAFIFYWIAFNAAYAWGRGERRSHRPSPQVAAARDGYFGKIIKLDDRGKVYDVIHGNEYVSQLLRSDHQGLSRYRYRQSRSRGGHSVHESPNDQYTRRILSRLRRLFDYLYSRRNQLIHGSATWNDLENRVRSEADARILSSLVPLFIDLMMDKPMADWGDPPYPAA